MTKVENEGKEFDLQERTAVFSERTLAFCRKIPRNVLTRPLISQLVRSATSIGANYCEADNSLTRKEFKYRIGICRREARETEYWYRLLMAAVPEFIHEATELRQEAIEFNLIFSKTIRTIEENDKKDQDSE
ncbi:MAG: four helix bundle protein [Patescibacteria group bacterium]